MPSASIGEISFRRVLGLPAATAFVVGTVIGTGIFLTTGVIAENVRSPGWILAAWAAGALIAASGAVVFAQWAALRPQAGGAYVYLREAWGSGAGFAYGWSLFLILQSGSIAAVALGFAHYAGRIAPGLSPEKILFDADFFSFSAGQLAAAGAILCLTLLHSLGAKWGGIAQTALTVLKVSALAALALAGWLAARGSAETLSVFSPAAWSEPPSAAAFGVALVAVLWAYAGWWNLNFAAEEIRRPERTIPIALALGMGLVALLYLAVNWVYVFAVPAENVRGVVPVAERAVEHLFGAGAARWISLAAAASALGALSGLIFTSPRAYFAMAREGDFFLPARLHRQFGTPHAFLWAQAGWAAALVFAGGYEALFTYVMFPGFLFTALACAALLKIRRTAPDAPLPMRALYPWAALFHLAVSLALAGNILVERPVESLLGAAVLGAAALARTRFRAACRPKNFSP